MKLLDNDTDSSVEVGSSIRDDFGKLWYIAGYGIDGKRGRFVQVVPMEKLAEVVEFYSPDTFDLSVTD